MLQASAVRPVGLKFTMAGHHLFTLVFPFMRANVFLDHLNFDPDNPPFSWDDVPASIAGVLFRSSPVEKDLPRLRLMARAIRYVPEQYQRYHIDLRGSFEDYLKRFSAKSRYNLKREVRKFTEHCGGELRWRVFRTPEEVEAFYGQAREVSRKTYQERLLHVGLPDDEEYRREMLSSASAGAARGYLLFDHDNPVSYLWCQARGEMLLYRQLGYNPDYRELSPGSVLQYLAFESLFGEGVFRTLDFGEGEGHHKRFYSTGSVRCANIYYFRRHPRCLAAVVLHASLESASSMCGRALGAVGLKHVIKRLLRSG